MDATQWVGSGPRHDIGGIGSSSQPTGSGRTLDPCAPKTKFSHTFRCARQKVRPDPVFGPDDKKGYDIKQATRLWDLFPRGIVLHVSRGHETQLGP